MLDGRARKPKPQPSHPHHRSASCVVLVASALAAALAPLASRWAGLGCSSLWLRCCVTCTAPTFPPHHDALAVTHSLKSNQTPPIDRVKCASGPRSGERRTRPTNQRPQQPQVCAARRPLNFDFKQERALLRAHARPPPGYVHGRGGGSGPPLVSQHGERAAWSMHAHGAKRRRGDLGDGLGLDPAFLTARSFDRASASTSS